MGRSKGRTHPASPGAGGSKKNQPLPPPAKPPTAHRAAVVNRTEATKHAGKVAHAVKKLDKPKHRAKSKIEQKKEIENNSTIALEFISERDDISKILQNNSQRASAKKIYADSDPMGIPPPPIITLIPSKTTKATKKSELSQGLRAPNVSAGSTASSSSSPPMTTQLPPKTKPSPPPVSAFSTAVPRDRAMFAPSPDQSAPCSSKLAKFLESYGFSFGQQLSSGSFSRVFRGKFKQRDAAVKVVDLANSAEEFRTKFFPRELYALRMLEHPYIINTYDVLAAEGRIFIFMELAERGDILDYVRRFGSVEEWMSKIWFRQMVDAVGYMHQNGFAHRDLKSENILLDSQLNTKLTDFGFSRVCFDFEIGSPIYSETYCGSSAYVAPEVLKGRK